VVGVAAAASVLAALALAAGAPTTSAAAQSWSVVNARDFRSIQDAVEALPREGGTVVVPAGVHTVREKIKLSSHVELRGEGMDRTILSLADRANDHLISNRDLREGNQDIAIRDIGLRGNAANQTDWSFGIRLVNVADSVVERVEAVDFSKDGFYLGYSDERSGHRGVRNVRVSDCRAVGNRRYGIALKHGSGNTIERCTFEGNGLADEGAGVKLGPDQGLNASGNRIVGNRAVGNFTGIVLFAAIDYDSRVRDNVVCGNEAVDNVQVGFQDFRGEGNVFAANAARGNGVDFDLSTSTLTDEAACS
jgi:parallel beta-helix repeat protein